MVPGPVFQGQLSSQYGRRVSGHGVLLATWSTQANVVDRVWFVGSPDREGASVFQRLHTISVEIQGLEKRQGKGKKKWELR